MKNNIVIYGSYGYTGQLIVQECLLKKLDVTLAGRDENKLRQQSEDTGLHYAVADINDGEKLCEILADASLVIHCAGPFQYTAQRMVEACLETKTHYTDITGEFRVFELLNMYDAQAKATGIMIMPGAGFDVVPSDCLAAHLKKRLPHATHLQLAFTNLKGGLSRGTARTSIEGLGEGSFIRENGSLKRVPMGARSMEVDFGSFRTSVVCIPWGDIVTAFQSTGIPNIEVYMGMPKKTIRLLRLSHYFNWLLKQAFVKSFLKKQVDKKAPGPSDERRSKGRSFLWGKASDDTGNTCITTLQTLDGYTLTAKTSVLIAEKISNGQFKIGYQTPSMAYGADLILEVETSTRKDY